MGIFGQPMTGQDINIHRVERKFSTGLFRLILPVIYYRTYIKVKPDIIIVNTHELLIVTLLYKILFGSRMIYDVQENYFRNIRFQNNHFILLKPFLAGYVRLIEYFASFFFDHALLAEQIYLKQLPFLKKKSLVIENKYAPLEGIGLRAVKENKKTTFLIYGTIAKEYGVFEGIHFFSHLKTFMPDIHLKIIGHCPNNETFKALQQYVVTREDIDLKIEKNPLSHNTLMREMIQSSFVLMPYQDNPSIRGKIPTKLYECLALHVPVVMSRLDPWTDLIRGKKAGYCIDFNKNNEDLSHLASQLKTASFYDKTNNTDMFWSSDEKRFLTLIEKVLGNALLAEHSKPNP